MTSPFLEHQRREAKASVTLVPGARAAMDYHGVRRTSDGVTVEKIRGALRDVIDPEVGINVVDLGLVYDVRVQDGNVSVAMTMTTPACPLGGTLRAQAEAAIRQTVPGVKSVTVDLVWDPPWRPSMISDAAKEQLGWAD